MFQFKNRCLPILLLFPTVSFMQKTLVQERRDSIENRKLSGVLEKIDFQTGLVIIDKEGERFIFNFSDKIKNASDSINVGDFVTVWYTMNIKKMTGLKERWKYSRTSDLFELPPGDSEPGKIENINDIDPMKFKIKDDRIFFDARNELKSSWV